MAELYKICNGVDALFINGDRFNTTEISINFYMPLSGTDIAATALLPFLLTSCGKNYPDVPSLSKTLLSLYGTEISGSCDKVGDNLWVRIYMNTLNDGVFSPTSLLDAAKCLKDLIFNPKVDAFGFSKSDFLRERMLTAEKIRAIKNDKRSLAIKNATALMFKGEAYGKYKLGELSEVLDLSPESVYAAYKAMLKKAYVRILVIGKGENRQIVNLFGSAFSMLNRSDNALSETKVVPVKEVLNKTEYADVAQSKLVLGFKYGFIEKDENSFARAVFSDIFGGGTYSKLFSVVREKMGLCYYCSARNNRSKGFLTVDSGVLDKNLEKTKNEILNQLELMKKGDFSDDVIVASKTSLCDSLLSIPDSASSLDNWYGLRPEGAAISPVVAAERIKQVKKEDIVLAANNPSLCVVYSIRPEAQHD